MMRPISFFTPVRYEEPKTVKQIIFEEIEDYFYFGGKSAIVIPRKINNDSQEVILKYIEKKDRNKWIKLLLVAKKIIEAVSFVTLIVPVIILGLKYWFRCKYHFHEGQDDPKKTTNNLLSKINDVSGIPAGTFGNPQDETEVNELVGDPITSKGEINSNIDLLSSDSPMNRAESLNVKKNKDTTAIVESIIPRETELTNYPAHTLFSESLKEADHASIVTVANRMDQFTKAWNTEINDFQFPSDSFNLESFSNHLSTHAKRFKKEGVDNSIHFGYIEKFDLISSDIPQIYMRADLHGDLKSLLENLRSLQEQRFLDESFKCKPGLHLVFLGDYCDRGVYGTQVLEMLMLLREENPGQVHLIRGNHEDSYINKIYGADDVNLKAIVTNNEAAANLGSFYETMSLTTYFSINEGESREYVQCTHGLFEITMDPAPLLDQKGSGAYIPVPKDRQLSKRIHEISTANSKLSEAAKRINKLFYENSNSYDCYCAYNWGDVSRFNLSITGALAGRQYQICAQDIRHYLDLSSEQHRVMMIFRGHQHIFQHLMHNDKVLVTTLPVGMDCPGYSYLIQPDRAYLIKLAPRVENWTKRAILREKGHDRTDEITNEFLLTSDEI